MAKAMVSSDGDITIFNELHLTGRRTDVRATREFYTLLARHPDLFRDIVRSVQWKTSAQAPRPCYRVPIDGDLPWPRAIIQAGFCQHDFGTLAQFPITGTVGGGQRETDIEIFRFWRNEDGEKIIAAMRGEGYRPIDIAELLALRAHAPQAFIDNQNILALNQRKQGYCVSIETSEGRPTLMTELVEKSTLDSWRFGAVKLAA